MNRTRLDDLFAAVRAEQRTAFLPFMTAGLPDPVHTVEMFVAMADAGADAFEVGIPYSDPLMDGPTIQAGGQRALDLGMTLEAGFDVVEQVAARTGKPTIVMSYANPVFRMGEVEFAKRCADAGAAAMIVADVPLEETETLRAAAADAGVGYVLFAAPTTPDARLDQIAAAEPVFIYGVAEMGVTGERAESSERPAVLAGRVRRRSDLPLVMGVGISTPDQALAVVDHADGVIVGSAMVRRVLQAVSPEDAANQLTVAVRAMVEALRGGA
jgi:tryptophan synthase alpha chain